MAKNDESTVVPSIVSAGAAGVTVYWDGVPSDSSSSLIVTVDDNRWTGNKIGLVVEGSFFSFLFDLI